MVRCQIIDVVYQGRSKVSVAITIVSYSVRQTINFVGTYNSGLHGLMGLVVPVSFSVGSQTTVGQVRNQFSSTVLGGEQVIPESNEWYVVSNDYAGAQDNISPLPVRLWVNPEVQRAANLYKMAAQNGVFPYPASHAQGYAKLTGEVGSPVPQSLEINTSAGVFVSVGTTPLTIPSSNEIIIRIRALTPGPSMNSAGTVTGLTLTGSSAKDQALL